MKAEVGRNPIFWIVLTAPLALLLLCQLQPTFDDWTYYTIPQTEPLTLQSLLPDGNYWRPFDVLFGHLLGLNHRFFPFLNHLFILLGHILNTLLIYKILQWFRVSTLSRNLSVVFFYLSSGTLGTILNIDSLNQVYSLLWGLLALYSYISLSGYRKLLLWLVCALLSVFAKESGYVWFLFPPFIVWSIGKERFNYVIRHLFCACLVFVFYLVSRFMLTDSFYLENNVYMEFTLTRLLRNLALLLGMIFYPIDYASLIHPQHRHLAVVVITGALPLPFLWLLLRSYRWQKPLIILLLSFFIGAFVNLMTVFSVMHCYAVLPFVALMIALLCERFKNKKVLIVSALLYLLTASFTLLHHAYASFLSGKVGEQMAKSIVSQCDRPVNKVMLIHLDKGETKYSSFWVIPFEAFGWGYSVLQQTGYQWPKTIINEEITNRKQLNSLLQKAEKANCDGVWYVEDDQVKRIK
ncbi:hypothetical protein [Prevotella melaninogenica]|uniref:Glycosyltransferase RgtA/B/C/D-like domain-containing protein n=1 Tax=Prevotella melaninogenica TaxID=28132 RepID=A0A250KES3_9BACT|nr:hypothetical protein [Prevotella melaninogenica]BBA28140.1 hypothetical protein PMEL1_00030 [Prevotella melaninogenica]